MTFRIRQLLHFFWFQKARQENKTRGDCEGPCALYMAVLCRDACFLFVGASWPYEKTILDRHKNHEQTAAGWNWIMVKQGVLNLRRMTSQKSSSCTQNPSGRNPILCLWLTRPCASQLKALRWLNWLTECILCVCNINQQTYIITNNHIQYVNNHKTSHNHNHKHDPV